MEFARRLTPRERNGLLLLLCFFCAFGVFDHSLWGPNDTREGAMVWDMWRSGNWTRLSLNGAPFLEKPPLLHWTALVLCKVFGRINAGLLRLPAALYGCGALLIVHQWGRVLGRERGGLLGAFLCGTTLLYAEYSRIVLTDICLTFMVTLSLHLFWLAYAAEKRRAGRFAVFLLSTALTFYAKGVLGPGLVMTSVVAFLVLRREWKLAILLPLASAPLLVAVVYPWATALYREGGSEYLISVFIDNQLGRFFSLPHGDAVTSLPLVGRFLGFMVDRPIPPDPYFVHKEPIYFYLVKLPIFWLPWTLLVPSTLAYWFARKARIVNPLATLLRCALVTIVCVLHVSSAKVACYALPLFPILFLMVGVWCDDVLPGRLSAFDAWMSRVTSAIVRPLFFILPCGYLILWVAPTAAYRQLEEWLRPFGANLSASDPASWIRAPGGGVAWRGAALCIVAVFFSIFAMRRMRASSGREDRAGRLLMLVAAWVIALMLTFTAVIPPWDFQRTYEPMAALVRAELSTGRCMALAVGQERDVGAFTYYTDTRLPEISLIPGVRDFVQRGKSSCGVIVRVEDLGAVSESLAGIEHSVREVAAGSGFKSKAFRLITRG